MVMFSRVMVRRPDSAYVAVYVPGGSRGSVYCPCASVIASRVPCSCGLVTVTVTPGIGLPDASVTMPVSAPVVRETCATAADVMHNRMVVMIKQRRDNFMRNPPWLMLRANACEAEPRQCRKSDQRRAGRNLRKLLK